MEQTKLKIAHGRPSLLVLVVVGALALAAPGAQAQAEAESGGLAGDACQLNSECMSRTCGADRLCVATTCGLSAALGGVGATAPSGYCSATTVYNPSRVCTFGFGKCAKAECCDTVSCSAGVKDQDKSTYCAKDQSFNSIRLCPNGVCSPSVCCAQTKCDGPGGVVVNKRATFCPSGLVFNNAGVCLGGNARCTSDDCCALDTRTCGVAFDDPQYKGGACPAPSRLVESRLFDEAKGEKGGCCETTTCATGVADSDKKAYCDGTSASTVFSGTPTCASGTCTQTDCCQSPKGFCDGTATQAPDGSCTCSEPNRSFLIGVGCACSAGFYLADGTTCTACPHGRYTGSPNTLPECAACPSNQPYTPSTATASADKCINYCDDRQFNGADQGVCSNGGTCASLTGDPAQGGAFSCTCPPLWMYYPPPQSTSTTPTNCDAPTTLLRVRILAAGGVTIPSNLKLLVTDTPVGTTPAYALQAPAGLVCEVAQPTAGSKVPVCSAGDASMSTAAPGSEDGTRKAAGTKVKLSSNYAELVAADAVAVKNYVIDWACSDGTTSPLPEHEIVLPGPTNTENAETLVCTAIVSHAEIVAPIKLQLAADSEVPVAADGPRGTALLVFSQVEAPVCTLAAAKEVVPMAPICDVNDKSFALGVPGALGVTNIDMERYTLSWSCSGGGANAAPQAMPTDVNGNAATPALPSPGQAVLVCVAKFGIKSDQLVLKVSSSVDTVFRVSAMQKGMNEACVATIPSKAAAGSDAAISCPVSNMASGVVTELTTDADLTKFLVSFSCAPYGEAQVEERKSIKVTTTPNGAVSGKPPTTCTITVKPLPALLSVRIVDLAGAKPFNVHASQDASDTCVVPSTAAAGVLCPLGEGMLPGVKTSLSPRALDANKYSLVWQCTYVPLGARTTEATDFVQLPFSNSANFVLNANPNLDGAQVSCVGTVAARDTPVSVMFAGPAAVLDALDAASEARVRQSHQSKACSATKPVRAASPQCDIEGLKPLTRTTLSTGAVDLAKYKVSWRCAAGGRDVPTTPVAAGVAVADTLQNGNPAVCTATIENKPPVLTLAAVVSSPPATPWTLSARQGTQGRACTLEVSGASASAAAPTCPQQPLGPSRATVLTTGALDVTRYAVAWACKTPDGQDAQLTQTISATGAIVVNSMTVSMAKDANTGGGTVACTAAVTLRTSVLVLKAAGNLPASGVWTLTAKQPDQAQVCSLARDAALASAAPACPGTIDLSPGVPTDLGVTGIPASSVVAWACTSQVPGVGTAAAVAVTNGNAGVAKVTPILGGAVTTCTASVTAATTPFLQIVGVSGVGVTYTAAQADKTLCTAEDDGAKECDGAAPNTLTSLVVAGMSEKAIARFSCKLPSGVVVPVSKTSGLTALVQTPTAIDTMVCTLSVVDKPPILTVTSNLATALTAMQESGLKCTSVATNKLVCDSGKGDGQLEAGKLVSLTQEGLTEDGYYRWACASSAAKIVRFGGMQERTNSATVTLPADGGSLTCSLTYSTTPPRLGRLLRRMMM